MHQQFKNRLKELKTEFEAGQKRLAELDAQQASLRETLLRISGAIQVLKEELDKISENSGSSPEQEKELKPSTK